MRVLVFKHVWCCRKTLNTDQKLLRKLTNRYTQNLKNVFRVRDPISFRCFVHENAAGCVEAAGIGSSVVEQEEGPIARRI